MGLQLNAQPSQGAIMPRSGSYYIQSAISYGRNDNGCWERPGGGDKAYKGENIRIWKKDNAKTKLFSFKSDGSSNGWYKIVVNGESSLVADVAGGDLSQNGGNIGFWEENGGANQRFLFHHMANGRFKIYTAEGKIVNLANNNDNDDNNVQIWDDHDSPHCEWFIVGSDGNKFVPEENTDANMSVIGSEVYPHMSYRIQSAMSYGRSDKGYLEFPGSNWIVKGNKMGIWTKDDAPNKIFEFEKSDNGLYYIISSAEVNGAIDCEGGSTSNGTKLHLWDTDTGNPAQQFYLKHINGGRYKIYHRSGKVVCLVDNSNDNDGNKVHIWDDHDMMSTEWYILDRSGNPVEPRHMGM